MFVRCSIISESDLGDGLDQVQEYLDAQPGTPKIVSHRTALSQITGQSVN